ncbi:MAG: DsrE family protein [Alphaproteobacteria bacterium]|nr:DsrE family protein [Alphaproteobacteria bacterium]
MKTLIVALVAAVTAVAVAGPVRAQSGDIFKGVTGAKVVWDVTEGDENKFNARMDLIGKTAESLKKRGIKPEFVLTIRGPATKFVTKTLDKTNFEKEKDKIKNMAGAQASLKKLQDSGTQVEVCAVAMGVQKVEKDNVQPFIPIADNVWETLIVLQNKGYAYMPID